MRSARARSALRWHLVLVGLLVSGCGESLYVSHVLTGPPLPAKPDDYVPPVFLNQTPGRPYREIAQIRVRSRGRDATLDNVLGVAVMDARELGADAVIVDVRSAYHSVEVSVDCQGQPSVQPMPRLNARVTAIVFTLPGAASPEGAPAGPGPVPRCRR